MTDPTPKERRLANLALIAVSCIAWAVLIVLGAGAWDWACEIWKGTR